jgi:hypothetical protein
MSIFRKVFKRAKGFWNAAGVREEEGRRSGYWSGHYL